MDCYSWLNAVLEWNSNQYGIPHGINMICGRTEVIVLRILLCSFLLTPTIDLAISNCIDLLLLRLDEISMLFCCTCEWNSCSNFWLWILNLQQLIYLSPVKNMIVAMRQLFCVTNTTRYCFNYCVVSATDSNYSTCTRRNTIIADTTVSMTTSSC